MLQGRGDELPALLPDLLFSVLLPYVGRDTALSLLKNERRRSKHATTAKHASHS